MNVSGGLETTCQAAPAGKNRAFAKFFQNQARDSLNQLLISVEPIQLEQVSILKQILDQEAKKQEQIKTLVAMSSNNERMIDTLA